jgi:hypothetical protein
MDEYYTNFKRLDVQDAFIDDYATAETGDGDQNRDQHSPDGDPPNSKRA